MNPLTWLGGGGIASPIEAIGNVFDKLFTSDEERAQANFVLERLRQKPHELQAQINMIEAGHRTVFVAGWRPFIGWVCGLALSWHFLFSDLAAWVTVNWFPHVTELPALSGTSELISIVLALLGLGGLRTYEKINGKAK